MAKSKSKSTVVIKKKGDRGGVNPGTASVNSGLLPYGAKTGGQSSADTVGNRVKKTHTVGYNER